MRMTLLLFCPLLLAGCGGTPSSSMQTPTSTPASSIGPSTPTAHSESSGESATLVAYFSVTSNTKKLAEYASRHLKSELFEIVPKQVYTQEDINYNGDCRANREQNDDSSRPEILNQIADISKYDTIVLGYPIWWGQAPKIMYSFVEAYDLKGKTILPFCTSGSSPIGTSATNLAKSAPEANWLTGERFASSASSSDIANWLDANLKKETTMKLTIDGKPQNVTWAVNESVKALKSIATNGLTIKMEEYGGFEQTGSIGQSIVRDDKNIDVEPGDIVLYAGNQISVFYKSHAWSYTRLGHINASQSELENALKKDSIEFVLSGK